MGGNSPALSYTPAMPADPGEKLRSKQQPPEPKKSPGVLFKSKIQHTERKSDSVWKRATEEGEGQGRRRIPGRNIEELRRNCQIPSLLFGELSWRGWSERNL